MSGCSDLSGYHAKGGEENWLSAQAISSKFNPPRAREVILILEGPDSLGVAVNGVPVDGADETTRKEKPGLVS